MKIDKRSIFNSLLLMLPTLALLFFLFNDGIFQQFDAKFYLKSIFAYKENGLFLKHEHLGYRAYLFPYLFSKIPIGLDKIELFGRTFYGYSIVATFLFLVIQLIVSYLFLSNKKRNQLLLFYFGFYVNPFVLCYIPFTLQESFTTLLLALFIPLIYFLFHRNKKPILLSGLVGLFTGLMYMTRASNVLLLIPAIYFAFILLRSLNCNKKTGIISIALFVILFLIPVIPQSAISYRYFKSINPYPINSVLNFQIQTGKNYAKYATMYPQHKNSVAPLPYWSPLSLDSSYSDNVRNYTTLTFSNTEKEVASTFSGVLFTSLIHLFNVVNYDFIDVYIKSDKTSLFSWNQVLSIAIVFLGLLCLFRSWIFKKNNAFDTFIDITLILAIGSICLFAVETRFSLISTSLLALKSTQFFQRFRLNKLDWFYISFSGLIIILLAALLSIYVLTLAGRISFI